MNCSVCNVALRPCSYCGQTIDACPKCGVMWLDPAEVGPLADELVSEGVVPDEPAQDAFNAHPRPISDADVSRLCPKCGVLTQLFNYAYDSNVFLNKCPTCHGLWVGKADMLRIAQYLKGNPAVNRYAQSLVDAVGKEREPSWASQFLRSRTLSGGVALVYLVAAGVAGKPAVFMKVAIFLILPVSCIWFADAIGGYSGLMSFPRPAITRKTPGFAIAIAGWILLLMPLVVSVIMTMSR